MKEGTPTPNSLVLAAQSEFRTRWIRLSRCANVLIGLSHEVIVLLHRERARFETVAVSNVTTRIVVATTKNLHSTTILCESGYGVQALAISRSSLEWLITLSHIVEVPEQREARSIRFWEFRWVELKRGQDRSLKEESISERRSDDQEYFGLIRERKREVDSGYESYRKLYGTESDSWGQYPFGVSPDRLAETLGLGQEYSALYPIASGMVHAFPSALQASLSRHEGGTALTPGPQLDGVAQVLKNACLLQLRILKLCNDLFPLDAFAQRVAKLLRRIRSVTTPTTWPVG